MVDTLQGLAVKKDIIAADSRCLARAAAAESGSARPSRWRW